MVMPLIRAAGLAIPQSEPIAESLVKPELPGTGPSSVKRIFEALARS